MMHVDHLEKFRQDFFDKVIKYELERDRQLKEIQLKCYHHYNIMGMTNQNGYQERTCSKCGHSATKSMRVWDGSKGCTVA